MFLKSALTLGFMAMMISVQSQRVMKVKRKGVEPIDVTKHNTLTSLYTLKQFAGKWQEVERKDRTNNSAVDFKDTLFFIFSGEDVYIRDGKSLSLKGKAALEPGNILYTGADEFMIQSLDKTKAVLDDQDVYIHTIIKKDKFNYEVTSNAPAAEKFNTPINVTLQNITGNWDVYRREAKPGSTPRDQPLLKTLNIKDKTVNESNGEISFYLPGNTSTIPCNVSIKNGQLIITTVNRSWQLDVYKADKNEFIFGSADLMYYCRPM